MKIDHIGIAVKSIEKALKFYSERLGLESMGIVEVPEQKVKVAALQIGESKIELLESTSPDSPIAKFLKMRGEGIHHLAFEVTDIEKRLMGLKEKGVRLIDEKPRLGAHNTRIAFIHPKSTQGVLIELVERY